MALLVAVFDQGTTARDPGALVVLAAMAHLADDAGNVRASSAEVAERAQVSAVTVRRAWPALIAAGDLIVTEPALGRRPALYQLARATGVAVSACARTLIQHEPVAVSGSARNGESPSRGRAVLALIPKEITNKSIRAKKAEPASFDDEFAQWWQQYPRKVGRAKALVQFTARRHAGVTLELLTTARDVYACEMEGKDRQYVLHGATFLGKDGRWSDDWTAIARSLKTANTVDWMG